MEEDWTKILSLVENVNKSVQNVKMEALKTNPSVITCLEDSRAGEEAMKKIIKLFEEKKYRNENKATGLCIIFYYDIKVDENEIEEIREKMTYCNFDVSLRNLTNASSSVEEINDQWNPDKKYESLVLLFHFRKISGDPSKLIGFAMEQIRQATNLQDIIKCILLNNPIRVEKDEIWDNPPSNTLLAHPRVETESGLLKIVKTLHDKRGKFHLWEICCEQQFEKKVNTLSGICQKPSLEVEETIYGSIRNFLFCHLRSNYSPFNYFSCQNTRDDSEARSHDYSLDKGFVLFTDGIFNKSRPWEKDYYLNPNGKVPFHEKFPSTITGIVVGAWSSDKSAYCTIEDGGTTHNFVKLSFRAGKYYTKINVKIFHQNPLCLGT